VKGPNTKKIMSTSSNDATIVEIQITSSLKEFFEKEKNNNDIVVTDEIKEAVKNNDYELFYKLVYNYNRDIILA